MPIHTRYRIGGTNHRDTIRIRTGTESRGTHNPNRRPLVGLSIGPIHIDLRADKAIQLANALVDAHEKATR